MNRPGYDRTERRPRIRLTLEHLECRRVMAGLNVLVFTDVDGSRSHSGAVDTPAANRLVYVDLNRDLAFNQGEPLALSDARGIASFPDLPAGDYLVALAANHPAQVVTTSVVPDSIAQLVVASGAGLSESSRAIVGSADLKHAWALSDNGALTPVGVSDSDRLPLELGGRVLGYVGGGDPDGEALSNATNAYGQAGWVLIERSSGRRDLLRLDFESGRAMAHSMQGIPNGYQVTGLVRAGQAVYLQMRAGASDYLASTQISDQHLSVGMPMPVPAGRVVGSDAHNRLAIVASRNSGEGDAIPTTEVMTVSIDNGVARTESLQVNYAVSGISYSHDGSLMFVAAQGGGLQVFSTNDGLQSVALLADASGPVSAGSRDGRLVTGSTAQPDALIVWDTATWTRVGQIKMDGGAQPITSLTVDRFGERLLAATPTGVLSARLANSAPQSVSVSAGSAPAQAKLGVRVIEAVTPLPAHVSGAQATDEDAMLEFDLTTLSQVVALGANSLFFLPGNGPRMGTLNVSPTGRMVYQSHQDAYGSDSATLHLYDGIGVTTLTLSLEVLPVNDPPSDMTIDTIGIAEAAWAGQIAGLVTVFDVDSDARYNFTTSDWRFVVVDGQLMLADGAELDYESEPVIELEITATDVENSDYVISRRVQLEVTDSNDPPTSVSVSPAEVSENSPGAGVGQLYVVDPDGHGEYQFSVSDDRFEIADGQLRLRPGVWLNYEAGAVVSVMITVTDSSAEGPSQSASSNITVSVLDGNDAPSGFTVSGGRVRAGETGAVVGAISVQDEDAHEEFSYGVSDDRFTVDGNVLRLKPGTAIELAAEQHVSVLVTVTDSGGASLSQPVNIEVVSDKPFHNARNPMDVDNDGGVYPRDVLILINRLNQKGSHVLIPVSGEGDTPPEPYFLDVNGDGMLTPMDVLIIVNHLNRRSTVSTETSTEGDPNKSDGMGEEDNMPHSLPNDGADRLAAGEGEGRDDWALACAPWIEDPWRAEREAIDLELEHLVEQLARVGRA